MNNQNYRDMVDNIIEQLPGVWNLRIKQLPAGPPASVDIVLQFPPNDPRQGMAIIYRRCDAYVLGYRTRAGVAYATHNQLGNVSGAIDLRFNDDYASLGWNRQGLPINSGGPTIGVHTLELALYSAAEGPVTAIQLCNIVVALAEGVRFKNVEKAVRGRDQITTEMVDWAQQLQNNNAILRQA